MRLFDMAQQYNDLIDLLQDETDYDLQVMIEGLEGKIEEKIENTVKVLKSLEADAATLDAEIQRLMKRKTTLGNNVAKLKSGIESTMRTLNIDKVQGTLHTISFKKNPPKLNVIRESDIPFDFYNTPPVEPKLDRKKLLDAMKQGLEIAGVEVIQETSLQIK